MNSLDYALVVRCTKVDYVPKKYFRVYSFVSGLAFGFGSATASRMARSSASQSRLPAARPASSTVPSPPPAAVSAAPSSVRTMTSIRLSLRYATGSSVTRASPVSGSFRVSVDGATHSFPTRTTPLNRTTRGSAASAAKTRASLGRTNRSSREKIHPAVSYASAPSPPPPRTRAGRPGEGGARRGRGGGAFGAFVFFALSTSPSSGIGSQTSSSSETRRRRSFRFLFRFLRARGLVRPRVRGGAGAEGRRRGEGDVEDLDWEPAVGDAHHVGFRRVERFGPFVKRVEVRGVGDVRLGRDQDVRARHLVVERLGREDVGSERDVARVHERDRRADLEVAAEVLAREGVEDAAGVAQAGGLHEQAVGLEAAQDLGHRDGEGGGDGAAQAPASDLAHDDRAGAVAPAPRARPEGPARRIQNRAVDAQGAELVHDDRPALLRGAEAQEVTHRGRLADAQHPRDDVHGNHRDRERAPSPSRASAARPRG